MEAIEPTKTPFISLNKQHLPKIINIGMLALFGLLMLLPTETPTTRR
jgi:hypothetical protein